MILLLTNKEDITVDYVVRELHNQQSPFLRLNTEELPKDCSIRHDISKANNHLRFEGSDGSRYSFNDIESVYFRRPGSPEVDQSNNDSKYSDYVQGEWEELLSNFYSVIDALWVNHPFKILRAENKQLQLGLAKTLGFRVPNTLITNDYDAILDFLEDYESVIVKPLKSSLLTMGEDEEVVFTNRIENADILSSEECKEAPVIYQQEIPKECDLRVTVVDNELFPVRIESQVDKSSEVDWRRAEFNLEHTETTLPDVIKRQCLLLVQELSLRFAAIDLIKSEEGQYFFLEVNPNGQWAWLEERTTYNISSKIVDLLRV